MKKMTNLAKWQAAFAATSCNVIREGIADGVKKIRDAEGNVIGTEDVHIPYTTRENEVIELGTCNKDKWRDALNKKMRELGFPEGFDPQVDGWTNAHAKIENYKKEDSKIGLQGLTTRQSGPAFAVETMGLILDVVTGIKVFAGIVILGSEEEWEKDNIHVWKAINNTVLPDCDRYITILCKRFNLDEGEIRNKIVIAHSIDELFSDELPEEAAEDDAK